MHINFILLSVKNLIRLFSLLFFISFLFIKTPELILAQTDICTRVTCTGGCTAEGQCLSTGFRCEILGYGPTDRVLGPGSTTCGGGEGSAILGGVHVPVGVSKYSIGLPIINGTRIGIVNFASVLLRVFTIVCGIFFIFNMVVAGYYFVTSSGDSATFGKFKDSLYYSLIGLFLLAAALMIAGLIGTIFFGSASYIIQPALFQAGTTVTP